MAVYIDTVTTITVEGVKGTWRVPSELMLTIDDVNYVRLAPYAHSLVRMLCSAADGAPKPIPKNYSLTCSAGYKSLVRLRNEAQQQELAEIQPTPVRSLFGGIVQPKARPRKRICRDRVKELRQQPQSIAIDVVPIGGGDPKSVSVLRPIHSTDCLTVVLDPGALQVVFDTIIHGSFGMPIDKHDVAEQRPKGIWKRGCRFIVPYQIDGIAKYKSRPSVDSAMEFKTDRGAQLAEAEPLQGGCATPLTDDVD